MKKKKAAVITPPDRGEVITMRPWIGGDWLQVRVDEVYESTVHGPSVKGTVMDNGTGQYFTALPLSHLVQTAVVHRVGWGKWDVTIPGGEVVHVKSKRAAQELCFEHGFVFREE